MQTIAQRRTPSQAVVDGLRAHGVELFFGLDGDHVISLYDALADAPDIRPITVKHENNAAIAAEVYARVTGRPGVVIVTAGPGALNSLPGVGGAYAAGVPLVHISGGVPRGAAKEAFHGVDEVDFVQRAFEPVTKWSVRVEEADEIPAVLDRAFALAVSGRPGPVHVEFALSALGMAPIAAEPRAPQTATLAAPAAAPPVADLVARLDAARQIVIVAGKGAWWPAVSEQLVRLAEQLCAPVAYTWDGHAAMPTVHPLALGAWGPSTGSHPATARAIAEADLVLGLGVRRGTLPANELEAAAGDRLVMLNAADDPATAREGEVASIAALAATVAAVAEGCAERPHDNETYARCARARELLSKGLRIELARHRDARPWHIGLALDALARKMTADTLVVSEVSNVKLWAPVQLPVFNPESYVQPGSWGAMGYAVPGALAAGLARPDKKVVALCGDTSFQMACSDFGTICDLGLPVVIAVHADGQIGMINDIMTITYGRPYATAVGQVDFVRYAEAFGARGIRADDPADLDAAWDAALAADGPVLLELRAGLGFPRPWPVGRLVAQGEEAESGA